MVLKVPVSQRVINAEVYALEPPRVSGFCSSARIPTTTATSCTERPAAISKTMPNASSSSPGGRGGGLEAEPDIIHANDWQTGLIPVYLKTLYRCLLLWLRAASIFTIHNIGYQGLFWALRHAPYQSGLGFVLPPSAGVLRKLNLLKGDVVFADAVTTGEPEIHGRDQNPEYGAGAGWGSAGPETRPLRDPERGGLLGVVSQQ